jgi:hypothetical protein
MSFVSLLFSSYLFCFLRISFVFFVSLVFLNFILYSPIAECSYQVNDRMTLLRIRQFKGTAVTAAVVTQRSIRKRTNDSVHRKMMTMIVIMMILTMIITPLFVVVNAHEQRQPNNAATNNNNNNNHTNDDDKDILSFKANNILHDTKRINVRDFTK